MNNIFSVKSIEELKECGKLKEIREVFKEKVTPLGLKGKTNSWANMYESVQMVQSLAKRLQSLMGNEEAPDGGGAHPEAEENSFQPEEKDSSYQSNIFLSQAAEYIFILTRTEGKTRKDLLGVNLTHYSDRQVAKNWMTHIARYVHPDNCKHPQAQAAFQELNLMYEEMIR